ncbi:hypothetical protein NYE40_23880 [Paenibacillus sp. FSL W8-1187]|uniref:hypothetical protein n=1 Tax=Paenibacillus sp. FSL W8-1187 TaxID=2975339 RepID=UPI0030DBECC0
MSTQNRKVGFYNFIFKKHGSSEEYFDRAFFKDFLEYVLQLPSDQQIIDIPRFNKAITVDKYAITDFHADHVVRIVFKSCKYNHSPDYMSSRDGTERNSDKRPHEGEKEKTHLCIRISTFESSLLLEERRNGVSINEITSYLNTKLKEYLKVKGLKRNFKIIYGAEPSRDFLSLLEMAKNIKVAELHTSKIFLGSEAMGVIQEEDNSMREDVVITVKAEPKESLLKRTFSQLYRSLTSTESSISRIRLYGYDENDNQLRIDSEPLKKVDYVTADLDEKGIVKTDSIFEKMYEVLEITGETP